MRAGRSERLWGRDYVIVMLASAGISFCNYFFFSTLPLYAQQLTGSAAYAGLMTGVYTFAALAARPFAGIVADRCGRTRVLVAGALLCALACGLYTLAGVVAVLIATRMLHGVGFGLHSTSGGAVAADVIPKSRMAEGIGYFGLYGTVAAAVGPWIALAIIGDGAPSRFRALFILSALVSLGSMLLDCCIGYERKGRRASTRPKPDAVGLPRTFLGFEYAVLSPSLVLVLLYVAMSSIVSFLPMFALTRHLGNVGPFFTVNALGLFLSRVFLGKVADRHGPDVVIIPSVILFAVSCAFIPFVASPLPLLLIAFPVGLAQGAFGPTINSLMFQRCSTARRGTASAAYFSSIDTGFGVGSILFGFVVAHWGYRWIYLGSSAACVAALVVYLAGVMERGRSGGHGE